MFRLHFGVRLSKLSVFKFNIMGVQSAIWSQVNMEQKAFPRSMKIGVQNHIENCKNS